MSMIKRIAQRIEDHFVRVLTPAPRPEFRAPVSLRPNALIATREAIEAELVKRASKMQWTEQGGLAIPPTDEIFDLLNEARVAINLGITLAEESCNTWAVYLKNEELNARLIDTNIFFLRALRRLADVEPDEDGRLAYATGADTLGKQLKAWKALNQ